MIIREYEFDTEKEAKEFFEYAKERMATMTDPYRVYDKYRISLVGQGPIEYDTTTQEVLALVANQLYIKFHVDKTVDTQEDTIGDLNS